MDMNTNKTTDLQPDVPINGQPKVRAGKEGNKVIFG